LRAIKGKKRHFKSNLSAFQGQLWEQNTLVLTYSTNHRHPRLKAQILVIPEFDDLQHMQQAKGPSAFATTASNNRKARLQKNRVAV
jgi:hypothetical protein